jgi:hypothetical protein
MLGQPSWKWLIACAPRRRRAAAARPRRCLPAVERLDDRILPHGSGGGAGVPPVVTTYLQIEDTFYKEQGAILSAEDAVVQRLGNQLPSSLGNYFLKIDDAFLKLDNSLGGPGSTVDANGTPGVPGGIDGVLISDGLSSAEASANASSAQAEAAHALASEKTILAAPSSDITPTAGEALGIYLKFNGIERAAERAARQLTNGLQAIEAAFIEIDPPNLQAPVAAAELAGGSLADLAVPPPAPAAVDAFLKFEGQVLREEFNFLKFETAVLNQFGDQVPAAAVDFFHKGEAAFLKIDADLTATGDALLGIGQPSGATANDGGAVLYRRVLLQQGRLLAEVDLAVAAADHKLTDAFLKLDSGFLKIEADFLNGADDKLTDTFLKLDTAFLKIETDFLKIDSADLSGPVQQLGDDLNAILVGLNQPGGSKTAA